MRLGRNPDVYAATLDGEVCLFNPKSEEYLNLNATGTCIWILLENKSNLEDLVETLQTMYNVDPVTCRLETERFIDEALERGMLQTN